MVLENDVVFGSVNANRRHYEDAAAGARARRSRLAAGADHRAASRWSAGRRRSSARPDDVKVVVALDPRLAAPGTLAAMSVDPHAGELPDPDSLIDVDALLAAYHDERPDPSESTQRVSFGTSGHRGTVDRRARSTRRTCSRSPRPSAATARRRGSTGRCSSAATPTRCPSRRRARSSRSWARTASTSCSTPTTAPTPTPVISHAILTHNRGGGRGTADGIVVTPSHNPPGDGGFKYNPPHGGPADTDVTAGDRGRGQRAARGRARRRQARGLRERGGAPPRLRHRLRRRPRRRDRPRRDPRRRPQARRRPARRREPALLGADRRAPRPRPRDRQRRARPDVPLRAARLGRQDPHGLLLAVRDGAPDRPQGPLRRRLRQRPRRRPPRHRHAVRAGC